MKKFTVFMVLFLVSFAMNGLLFAKEGKKENQKEGQKIDIYLPGVATNQTSKVRVTGKETLVEMDKAKHLCIGQTEGKSYPWPGITFFGQWNLKEYSSLEVVLINLEKTKSLKMNVRVDDSDSTKNNRWLTTSEEIKPGASETFVVRLPQKFPDYLSKKVFGMRAIPGNITANYETGKADIKSFDSATINAIWVFVSEQKEPVRFAIKSIIAKKDDKKVSYPWTSLSEQDFFPMIDKYGQFKHSDWPGKIHNDQELRDMIQKEEADLSAHPVSADWDKYGGWKSGPQLKATGHFRVEKCNGRWWLVDPLGHLFWSHGVDCVRSSADTAISEREYLYEDLPESDSPLAKYYGRGGYPPHGYYVGKTYKSFDYGSANQYRKYGPNWFEPFSANIHRRLASWGMNTIANWSDSAVYLQRKTPYVMTAGTSSPKIEGSQGFWGKFPDPFHKEFRVAIGKSLDRTKEVLNDPWCIGIFVNNEIAWGGDTSLSEAALASPKDQPVKKVFVDWLQKKYQKIDELNKAWKSEYKDWNAMLETQELPKGNGKTDDLKSFYSVIAEEYFRVIHEVLREKAPHKLDLGCRFAWKNDAAVIASTKYLDVVSFNMYTYSVADFKLPNNIDLPCIIGEFHFGALDRGMFHTGLKATENQADRAKKYEEYVRGALLNPHWVGTHWFQYMSQATTGRFDGENYQIGLVDFCDTPYKETIEAVRRIGREMYTLRYGQKQEK